MKQLEKLKMNNIMSVLEFLRLNENSSKKYISSSIGLSSTLLTNICNHLKEKNLIIEGETLVSNKAGRREIALNINYDLKKIIGINISSEYCEVVISDLKPNLLFSKKIPTNPKNSEGLMEYIFDIIFDYIKENKLSTTDFVGIGVNSKGTIDIKNGIIGEDFLDEKIEIREYIKNKIDLPVFIENDVKSLSIAQNFFFPEYNDFFLIKYTIHGIGGAIFKNGTLYTNNDNIVGQIGHVIINPNEDYCPVCKRKGCLESIISINKIKKELSEVDESFNEFSIEKMFSALEKGSVHVNNILRKSASFMAQSIINTYAITGNEKIILYGNLFSYKEYMFFLEQYIKEYQLTDFWKNVVISKLSPQQESLASCVMVIKKVFYEELNKYFHFL
ncbi:ROK family protein [Fusobacterium sp.]|uniref:ROK family protein n=1 Tax=Fusobacterium sp. TaxID=68766 RepID=UPI0026309F2D|nr:ROK family protein [Fusobacterium sp.]